MIANKREFYMGASMLITFTAVLAIMFSPIYHGANALSFLDNMFNSISKGSAYYIPEVKAKSDKFIGKSVTLTIKSDNAAQNEAISKILNLANARVETSGESLIITADLGQLLDACLKDSELMYNNNGDAIQQKYAINERVIMFNWYQLLKKMEKGFTKEKQFKEAKLVATVNSKAVETAYNYYKVEAKSIKASAVMLVFSLVFYVIYTMWYGFGILFMFEGIGMQIEH